MICQQGALAAPDSYGPCVTCHGEAAQGNPALGAPALAGQLGNYLERQLRQFRSGDRGAGGDDSFGSQMAPFARQLRDDAEVERIAAFLSGLEAPESVEPWPGDPRRGQNLYNGSCGACHGGRGEGNAALASPRLAGLHGAYLKRQFEHFRDGQRGAAPEDRYGRQMAMMARTLPDGDAIDDILAYLATL